MSQYTELFSLLRKASETLKYPKLKFSLDTADKVTIYLATKGYIAIKINNIYSGKIAREDSPLILYGTVSDRESYTYNAINQFCLNPSKESKIYGQKYGHCCFCGLELNNSISVYNGYGPICAEKYGLPWEPEPAKELEL